jgi:ATP-dependent protease Clp ATPase subunit
VGVYNHYKRIFVAESQAAASQRRAEVEEGFIPVNTDGPKMSDLNLGQFGSVVVKDGTDPGKGYCETPDINSITDASFARDVEDCEIDKSNILLLGTLW